MDSVPLIIPLLEKEFRSTTRKLNEINQELRLKITYVFVVMLNHWEFNRREKIFAFHLSIFLLCLFVLKCDSILVEETPIKSFPISFTMH